METFTALHAGFAAAVAAGDVARVEALLTLPEVAAQVERVAASISGVSVDVRGPCHDLKCALSDAVRYGPYDFFTWLFADDRAATWGVILAAFFRDLVSSAVARNHLEMLEDMLSSNFFTGRFTDEDRQHLLACGLVTVIQFGTAAGLDILVAHGAGVHYPTSFPPYSSPFCGCHYPSLVDAMAQQGVFFIGANVNIAFLLQEGVHDVTKAFINQGVAIDNVGYVLHFLVQESPENEALLYPAENLLTLTCIDVDFTDRNGKSALMKIPEEDDSDDWDRNEWRDPPEDFAKLLLQNGADVNLQDKSGLTPLHYACRSEFPKLVSVLLRNGANVDAQSKSGDYPHDEIDARDIDSGARSEIMDHLLAHGANLHLANRQGDTTFSRLSATDTGRAFIEARSDVIRKNSLK